MNQVDQTEQLAVLIEQASVFYSRGDLLQALHLYDQAVLLDSTNHVLFSNRSAILCRLGRYDESLEQAEHSIQLNPSWAKAYLRKGDSLKGVGKFEKAMIAYCKGLTVDKENSQLLNALIQCSYASVIRDDLSSVLSSLKTTDRCFDAFVVVSAIGEQLLAHGHTLNAIVILNHAIDIDTESLQLKHSVLGALSKAHYELRNYRKAIDYLDIQLEITQQLEDVANQLLIHENIAKIAFIEDELPLAILHIRHAIELKQKQNEPTDSLYETLGGLFAQIGELDAAEFAFSKVNSISVNFLMNRAKIAIAKNKMPEAIGYCDQMKRMSATLDERITATLIRCKCLLRQSEPNKALRILKSTTTRISAEEPSPLVVGLLFGILSECNLAIGQYLNSRKWAKRQLKIAIGCSSRSLEADALRNMASVYEAIKDPRNALALWNKYDELIQNDNIETRLNSLKCLAKLNENCNNMDRAEEVLQKRLKLAERISSAAITIDAHSDLIRFYRQHKKDQELRLKHFEAIRNLYNENAMPMKEALILEDSADFSFDRGDFSEAIDHYEQCLMLVQEDGDALREAEICAKLGDSHWALFHTNEAIAYYEQSLTVHQQLGNIRAMMKIYLSIAKIHLSRDAYQECQSCLRCTVTLAGFIGDEDIKLDALLKIGRILLKERLFSKAKKVLLAALALAKLKQRRREIGLLYGYLAECYIGFGNQRNKQKALLKFCEQLPYFDCIDDTEGKCETLRHLVEEKRLNGDVLWTLRLMHNRIAVASEGSIDLQVNVLEESTETALKVHENEEAIRFNERALTLCIKSRHPQLLNVLLNLCTLYKQFSMNQKSILILNQFIRLASSELKNHLECDSESSFYRVFYELAHCYRRENDVERALEYFTKAHEATDNKNLKYHCEYAICCCHFYMKNYAKSLEHLHKSLQLKINFTDGDNEVEINEHLTRSDRLDKALIEWFCGESVDSLETIQVIADECCDERVAMALDETCLYEVLECEKFVGVPLLHSKMMHGEFDHAKDIIDVMYTNKNTRNIASIIDEAIVLWNRNQIQECVTLLDEYLLKFQRVDDNGRQQTIYNNAKDDHNTDTEANIDTNEMSIFAMHNNGSELLKLVNVILILCIINPSNEDSIVESLAIVERYICHQLKRSNPLLGGTQTNINAESTKQCLNKIQRTFLYCFRADRFLLCWYKQQSDQLRVCFVAETNPTNHFSKFYTHFLEQFLCSSKIKYCELSEFERLKSKVDVLVNVDSVGGVQYENRIALHTFSKCRSTTETNQKICLVIATDDRNSFQIDHVGCLNENDLIWKLQVCSLALIDCSCLKMDSFSILQYQLSINIAFVLNDPCEKITKALLLAGAECVVSINNGFSDELKTVLHKLVNGESLKNCLKDLRGTPLRLYGNRNAICHSSGLQLWRKAVMSTEVLNNNDLLNVEYPQYVEIIDELKRLPSQRYSRVIDLMQSNDTQQIYTFMNELENELEQMTSNEGSTSCFLATAQSSDLTNGDSKHDIKGLIALCKRIFDDHLYGLDDTDSMRFEDEHLNELMKSFALKEREVKRRRRRKKCSVARKCWSEGEGASNHAIFHNSESSSRLSKLLDDFLNEHNFFYQ